MLAALGVAPLQAWPIAVSLVALGFQLGPRRILLEGIALVGVLLLAAEAHDWFLQGGGLELEARQSVQDRPSRRSGPLGASQSKPPADERCARDAREAAAGPPRGEGNSRLHPGR